MISLIVSSANPALLAQLKAGAAETIGVPHEFVIIENSTGDKGMCQAYNEGIDRASHDLLCFLHEDILFKTNNWGQVVQRIFSENPGVGVLGVAGTVYKSAVPGNWGNYGFPHAERSHLLQSFKYNERETVYMNANPGNEQLAKVAVVDGVWICARKEIAKRVRFDSKTFHRFHCYDLDFCLAAGDVCDVAVTYEVLLQHLSEGNYDRQWMEDTLRLHQKWQERLPHATVALTKGQIQKIEKRNFAFWLEQIHGMNFSESVAYRVLRQPNLCRALGLKYYLKLHYSIFRTYRSTKKR